MYLPFFVVSYTMPSMAIYFCLQILCLQFRPTTWSHRRSVTWRCWFYEPIRITNSRFGSSLINRGVFKSPVPQHTQMLSPRRLMVLVLACAMASADDEGCALRKALGKPKIRDNYVYFIHDLNKPNVQVQLNETSHSVTQGQPYEGVFTLGYYLDVRTGCHESSEVADDFNAGITGENGLGLYTISDSLPEELNFEGFGILSVTIDDTARVCPEMRIAQDHYPGMNKGGLVDCRHFVPAIHQLWPCNPHLWADSLSSKRTDVPLRPYQCRIFWIDVCGYFWCAVWLVKTEQLSSILVNTNHFAIHWAESIGHLHLCCWKRTCVLWKTRWSAIKTIQTTTTFVPNEQCWQLIHLHPRFKQSPCIIFAECLVVKNDKSTVHDKY